MCGVFGAVAPGGDAARLAAVGLFALQHRGQESAGIAASDGDQLMLYKDLGLIAQVLDERHAVLRGERHQGRHPVRPGRHHGPRRAFAEERHGRGASHGHPEAAAPTAPHRHLGEGDGEAAPRDVPVSYTHLTLPTIYSV